MCQVFFRFLFVFCKLFHKNVRGKRKSPDRESVGGFFISSNYSARAAASL